MSRTMIGDGGAIADLRERRGVFTHFLAGPGAELGGTASLGATLNRALARQALWQACQAYDRGAVEQDGAAPVEELVGFAREAFPRAGRLPEWWGLRLRRRIGPGRSAWFPPFLATRASHRLRGHLEWRRRHRWGV